MKQLSDAVQQAIQNELPNMVGKELKDFISNAEANEERLKIACASRDTVIAQYEELLTETKALRGLKQSEEQLNRRELTVQEEKRDLRVIMAELKASEADRRATDIYKLVDSIFRNKEIRQEMFKSVPVVVPPAYSGGHPTVQTHMENTTSTTKEE